MLMKDMVLSWRGIPEKVFDLEISHFAAALLLYVRIIYRYFDVIIGH